MQNLTLLRTKTGTCVRPLTPRASRRNVNHPAVQGMRRNPKTANIPRCKVKRRRANATNSSRGVSPLPQRQSIRWHANYQTQCNHWAREFRTKELQSKDLEQRAISQNVSHHEGADKRPPVARHRDHQWSHDPTAGRRRPIKKASIPIGKKTKEQPCRAEISLHTAPAEIGEISHFSE